MNQNTINSFFIPPPHDEFNRTFNEISGILHPVISIQSPVGKTISNDIRRRLKIAKNSRNVCPTNTVPRAGWTAGQQRSESCIEDGKEDEVKEIAAKSQNTLHGRGQQRPALMLAQTDKYDMQAIKRGRIKVIQGQSQGATANPKRAKTRENPRTGTYNNVAALYQQLEDTLYPDDSIILKQRAQDLEAYVELLRQKLEETSKNNSALLAENAVLRASAKNPQNNTPGKDCEDMYENYSALAKDCMRLRASEAATFERLITACQEKEKSLVDCKLETSHQRTKIKLLQETVAKRNDEFEAAGKKNRQILERLDKSEKTIGELSERKVTLETGLRRHDKERAGEDGEKLLARLMKKYGTYMPQMGSGIIAKKEGVSTGGRKSSAKGGEEEEDIVHERLDTAFLGKGDIDLVFPTQLKSYYASSEL